MALASQNVGMYCDSKVRVNFPIYVRTPKVYILLYNPDCPVCVSEVLFQGCSPKYTRTFRMNNLVVLMSSE